MEFPKKPKKSKFFCNFLKNSILWLLVIGIGYWYLVFGIWLLVFGYWYWYWLLVIGYWLLDNPIIGLRNSKTKIKKLIF